MAGYTSPRILEIFRNCDIDHRHFHLEAGQTREETASELNGRYLRGATETGCRAVAACLESAQLTPIDVDLFVVCTSTGYVCPDLGSRLMGHMGFRRDTQRAAIVGLGCAAALPGLQRTCDLVLARPHRTALILTVEICSACYLVDATMDTVIGNAICADGAAAFVINGGPPRTEFQPAVVDFESYVDTEQIDKVGFVHHDGKLRVVLANAGHRLAGPMIERAVDALLDRNGLRRANIKFWIMQSRWPKGNRQCAEAAGTISPPLRF
jgi:predicted naringenin-chalcone synthase